LKLARETLVRKMEYPSGFSLATMDDAKMPLAPGLLSTTTDAFRCFERKSASWRPVASAPEPGPCGITSRMGRDG
jgi:hypothetical protein